MYIYIYIYINYLGFIPLNYVFFNITKIVIVKKGPLIFLLYFPLQGFFVLTCLRMA